jgi:serine O-acetyltransferase
MEEIDMAFLAAERIHRLSNSLYRRGFVRIARLSEILNYLFHNSYIPAECNIGNETKFAYGGIAVVIHRKVTIGKHCMIGQCVTIGGKSGEEILPTIEDNVYISPGARILGKVKVGHDSIIGANAVVIHDVEPYSVVAGSPAALICYIDENNYSKYRDYYGPIGYKKSGNNST